MSGGLDGDRIEQIVREEPSVTAFGVGTSMGVSADAPALDIAYKLTSYAGRRLIQPYRRPDRQPSRTLTSKSWRWSSRTTNAWTSIS